VQIKVNGIEFTSFKDGKCDIYTEDEEGNKTYKYTDLGFEKRVLGYARHFAAKAVQTQVNSVVRIPKLKGIDNHDTVEIKGLGTYEIELVQEILDSNPLTLQLTLKQLEMFEND
jgi:hypothetical protein